MRGRDGGEGEDSDGASQKRCQRVPTFFGGNGRIDKAKGGWSECCVGERGGGVGDAYGARCAGWIEGVRGWWWWCVRGGLPGVPVFDDPQGGGKDAGLDYLKLDGVGDVGFWGVGSGILILGGEGLG